jgi:hypothetical protein
MGGWIMCQVHPQFFKGGGSITQVEKERGNVFWENNHKLVFGRLKMALYEAPVFANS